MVKRRKEISKSAAADFLCSLGVGQTIAYHTGFLAQDRDGTYGLNEFAKYLYEASEGGFVLLTQKRLGPRHFEYRATRTIRKLNNATS